MENKKVVLMILDGWGEGKKEVRGMRDCGYGRLCSNEPSRRPQWCNAG
jgi:hypothetical protein